MNKKIITFSILVIVLVIILAGCSRIAKEKYTEKKAERINNTQTSPSEINGNTKNNESDTPPKISSLNPGDYKYSIMQGETERYYLLHVPKSYNGKPTPLVLAFHGGMGSAEQMAHNYDLITKSDEEGFIVAFLNGASKLPSKKFATWNAGNCCGYAVKSNSPDVEFVEKTIEEIKTKINIEKIYAIGISNGGMFSYRLACDMADTFTAIASVAGTDNYDGYNSKKPISIIHIHSLVDTHVLFEGGCGPDCNVRGEVEFVSVPDTISKWVKRNNCNAVPERVLDNNGAYCDLYTGCNENTEVKLCVTDDGGHSWPGLEANSGNLFEKSSSSQKISATDEIWDFFVTQ